MNDGSINNENDSSEIRLIDIIKIIWKYRYFIILFTIIMTFILISIYYFQYKKIDSYTIVYNIDLEKMNYNDYKDLLILLSDKDNLTVLFASIPEKLKKANNLKGYISIFNSDNNELADLKFYYSKELIMDKEKDLFKGFINSNGEFEKGILTSDFYISSNSNNKNIESKIELMNFIFYSYFKVIYNFLGFENIIYSYLYQIPSWKNVVYANYLAQKEKLNKDKEVLLQIKRKYPSLNAFNANIINIQGDSSENFISTDVRLANIEIALSNIQAILDNYYISKIRYDFYKKIINDLNSYMFKSFNEKTNDDLFNNLLSTIENYNISSDQSINKVDIKNVSLQEIIDSDKENLINNLTDYYVNTDLIFTSKLHINVQKQDGKNIFLIIIFVLLISGIIAIFLTFIINYIKINIKEIKDI